MTYEKVTRISVVMFGQGVREFWASGWEFSLQDDGRTLKLFGQGSGHEARIARELELAKDFEEIQRKQVEGYFLPENLARPDDEDGTGQRP